MKTELEIFKHTLENLTDRIYGSPLTDRLILAHMKAGNIVINPFNEKNMQSSSYDIRLGRYYFEEQHPGPDFRLFNPYKSAHVRRVWGRYKEARRARILMDQWHILKDEWENIDPEDEVIILEPGKTYLCHTIEFIGFRNVGTTMMKARSSLGRDFIEVCKCAGWGDIGYTNRWAMEVTNNSTMYSIPLVVGTRVAQLVFFYTGETDRPYPATGSYQDTASLEELEQNWSPESLLPRLRKD